MSTSTDEFEFTEFTEEELSRIDSIADAAFASDSTASPSAEPVVSPEKNEPSLPVTDSRSRKSSFSAFDLTQEELRLLDESVTHLESNSIQLSSGNEPPATLSARSTSYIEISLESPLPSTLAPSPAPTLGRASSLSSAPTTRMSLYTQFRLYRNSLSVSDLVGPAWCELQFDYGLRGARHLPAWQRPAVLQSRTGKIISVRKDVAEKNDVVKQRGTTVHKKLEREIRPTEITVTAATREDRWGLKLLGMLSNIRILIDEGRCREMPVMGFVHGHFVSGIIDEITRTAAPPVSPTSPASPTVPGHFSNASSSSDATTSLPLHVIRILDNKTRGVPSIPKPRDSYQSRLQLMLYKRLLDGLLESPLSSRSSPSSEPLPTRFSFPAIWEHHSVNPLQPFSAQFLEESAVLVLGNQLGSTAAQAKCLKDLERAWGGIVGELAGGERIGDQGGAVSKTLKLVYRLRERSSEFKKRSAAPSSSSSGAGPSNRSGSPNGMGKARRGTKKSRADSEDVELQRAIHASLIPSSTSVENEVQESAIEVLQEGQKGEKGIERVSGDAVRTPGGWISTEDDLQRAIQESIRSYKAETGKDASLSSTPPSLSPVPEPPQSSDRRHKYDSDKNIIGTVEFDHDDTLLDQHLNDVLDFWHDRRPPRGVALEDTGRCRYCEFAEGCEWLEAKAAEIMTRTRN